MGYSIDTEEIRAQGHEQDVESKDLVPVTRPRVQESKQYDGGVKGFVRGVGDVLRDRGVEDRGIVPRPEEVSTLAEIRKRVLG